MGQFTTSVLLKAFLGQREHLHTRRIRTQRTSSSSVEIDTLYPQYASLDSLEREGRGKDPSDPLLPRDIHDFRFFKRKRTKEDREREREIKGGEKDIY